MKNGARTLVLFGLALVIVAILVHVVVALLAIALPLGIGLIIGGILWHLFSGKPD